MRKKPLRERYRGGLLRRMRMQIAFVNFQFPINGAAEFVMRNHPADRPLDEQFRMPSATCPGVFRFVAADETGKTHEGLLLFFLAGEADLVGIDHDHEVTCIDMRRDDRLFFTPEEVGGFDRDPAEHLVARVDDPPFAVDLAGFSGKRFHRERKGPETISEAGECQQDVGGDFSR